MKAFLAAAALAGFASTAMAGEQVWRYVDARTGEVSYSNVQVKGKKGEKVEIMSYPTAAPSVGSAPAAVGAPIPADVLRQLKASDSGAKPPSGLPPLPSLPGASAAAAAPSPTPPAASPTPAPAPARQGQEPSWAKEAPAKSGPAPSWAQDPFAGK